MSIDICSRCTAAVDVDKADSDPYDDKGRCVCEECLAKEDEEDDPK